MLRILLPSGFGAVAINDGRPIYFIRKAWTPHRTALPAWAE